MNTFYLTREQARRIDQRAIEGGGFCGMVLMENAGRGCVESLLRRGVRGPVLICCGKGNNGGDGLVMARWLALAGVEARVLVWGPIDAAAPDALANYRILESVGYPLRLISCGTGLAELREAAEGIDWVVDALLGTGARGTPRAPLDEVITAINGLPVPCCAVDIPSGLDADTGEPASPTIRARLTCTMVAPKVGFQSSAAREYLGEVDVVQIGVPYSWLR